MTPYLRRSARPGVVVSVTLAAALTACGTSGISGHTSSSTPLAGQTINLVFELAQCAPSNCNVQPWTPHVVSGAKLKSFARR